jgi:hypothetical protein
MKSGKKVRPGNRKDNLYDHPPELDYITTMGLEFA